MRSFLFLGVALSLGIGGYAAAQAAGVSLTSDEIIAQRQSRMELQNGIAFAMKAAVDNGWDLKPFVEGAKAIVASSHDIPALFPPGTEQGHKTKAKPEIWSNRADFDKDADNLGAAAEKVLQAAEADDKAAFKTEFDAMGKACGACHRQYRER